MLTHNCVFILLFYFNPNVEIKIALANSITYFNHQ